MPAFTSLRSRLMMFTCIGFLIGLAGVTWAGSSLMWHSSEQAAEETARGVLREYVSKIARDIGEATEIARTTATVASVLGRSSMPNRNELGAIVRGVVQDNPNLLGVTLVFEPNALDGRDAIYTGHEYSELNGGRFATYAYRDEQDRVAIEKLDMTDPAVDVWYGTPINAQRTVITPAYVDQINGVSTLITTIAAPVSVDGKVIGASGVDFALADISAMIGALQPFGAGSAALVDGQGRWLAAADPALLGLPASEPWVEELTQAALRDGITELRDGPVYRAAVLVTLDGLDEHWVLTISVPQDAMVAGAIAARNTMLLVSFGILVVALVAASWVASRFARPISTMSGIMHRLAGNELGLDVPFIGRKDEIGEMAAAVDVFRQNALRIEAMTQQETEGRVLTAQRAETMAAFQREFAGVVSAGLQGDFSARVRGRFGDADIDQVAGNFNALLEGVSNGLSDAGDVLAALANTDLTARMQGEYEGAFARLGDDTNALAGSLTDIVRKIRATSGQLRSTTGEILDGANDLSVRTARQATTVEQTRAAIESLAATVSENSKRADDASGDANRASQVADSSGEVMERATIAMQDIAQSSRQIHAIVGLIDDIAFQTNLLALNASVEAARAGDAGKGFGVVAIEVRRLAQSAAQASSDIKTLIDRSRVEVESGAQLVREAAEKLGAIRDLVRDNTMLMGGISTASNAQAKAIADISVAMRQMDEMTQHNAALVEETNAAIEQTDAQVGELDRLIAVFKVDQRSQPSLLARAS